LEQLVSHKQGLTALSPLMLMVALYLVVSVVTGDFYKVPLTIAFLIASIYAVAIRLHEPLKNSVDTFSRGAGQSGIMLMLWIFVLAGAFAASAKEMGAIDATVNLTLNIMPSGALMAGLFITSCFISLSIGTSVGTIVALVPIAAGLAHSVDANLPLMVGIVVGGAFFGDNLSFISDTTIAATQTQRCDMKDKFKVNIFIVLPAAIAILVAYAVLGAHIAVPTKIPQVDYIKVTPYLIVLITSVCGMNVMMTLTLGLLACGVIGIGSGAYGLLGWMTSMANGVADMSELIIVTMLAGGLLELVKTAGGVDYIIQRMQSRIHGKRGAELSIGMLVSLVNCCTANNTVAILTVGSIARQISEQYGVDSRKTASILDTFSCFVQGVIPYGAQMLMAAGLAQITPTSIVPYSFYQMAIGLVALLAILFRLPRQYS